MAKNWTPELAARETKIKVDRLHDLESDDYSHFSSPTYARGFVRTYARSLGLDEYNILRQLDNKLPDDDSANIVNDNGGVAYLPETSLPPRVAHRDYTGLYIVMALGGVVALVIAVVLFEAYRVGELSRWLGNGPENTVATSSGSTNSTSTPAAPATDSTARALPVDSNTPPPIVETPAAPTNAPTPEVAPSSAPRALPVDSSTPPPVVDNPVPAAAPATEVVPVSAPRALPVDPSELNNAPAANSSPAATPAPAPTPVPVPPRALPVSPSELAADTSNSPKPTAVVDDTATPAPSPAPAANGPVMEPSMPPVAPPATTNEVTGSSDDNKPLVLTASQDSYVKVTDLDSGATDKPVYSAVLHSGQSIAFSGHRFSINVGIPAAVDIKLDGVNYGPHSDGEAPETFTVQSHLQ